MGVAKRVVAPGQQALRTLFPVAAPRRCLRPNRAVDSQNRFGLVRIRCTVYRRCFSVRFVACRPVERSRLRKGRIEVVRARWHEEHARGYNARQQSAGRNHDSNVTTTVLLSFPLAFVYGGDDSALSLPPFTQDVLGFEWAAQSVSCFVSRIRGGVCDPPCSQKLRWTNAMDVVGNGYSICLEWICKGISRPSGLRGIGEDGAKQAANALCVAVLKRTTPAQAQWLPPSRPRQPLLACGSHSCRSILRRDQRPTHCLLLLPHHRKHRHPSTGCPKNLPFPLCPLPDSSPPPRTSTARSLTIPVLTRHTSRAHRSLTVAHTGSLLRAMLPIWTPRIAGRIVAFPRRRVAAQG